MAGSQGPGPRSPGGGEDAGRQRATHTRKQAAETGRDEGWVTYGTSSWRRMHRGLLWTQFADGKTEAQGGG